MSKMFQLLLFTFLFFAFWPTAKSQQNLIHNGSFEEVDSSRTLTADCIQSAYQWEVVAYTYHHDKGTLTLCNSKIGVMDGSNAVYLHAWEKKHETIGQKLSQSLIKGKRYKLSFYAAFYDADQKDRFAFLDVGFGKNKPQFEERIPDLHEPVGKLYRQEYTLQEANKWELFSICFTATEDSIQYISFSSLDNDHLGSGISESRVYIDDVRLVLDSVAFDIGNDTIICPGDSFSIAVPYECAEQFLWYSDSTPYVFDSIYTIYGPGDYYLNIINECFSIGSDTINVSLKEKPLVDLGLDTIICPGDTLILQANSNQMVNYRWQDGKTTPIFKAGNKGKYFVEITNECGLKASDTIEINTIPLPKFELGDDFELCHGDSFLIELANNNYDYVWQDGSNSLSYMVKHQGVYWVTASNRCSSFTDSIHATIYEKLEVNFQEIFYLDQKILVVESNDYETYQWMYCDSTIIDGETNPSFINPPAGVYAVIVQKNGCVDTSECKAVEYINEADPRLLLYPNPTTTWVNLDYNAVYSKINIRLYSLLGQEIFNRTFYNNEIIRFKLWVENGPYLLEVKVDQKEKEYFKLIKTGKPQH